MKRLPLLVELGYLLGLLGVIRLRTLFLVVQKAVRRREQEEGVTSPSSSLALLGGSQTTPGVFDPVGLGEMQQFVQENPTWRWSKPRYDLTRDPYWGMESGKQFPPLTAKALDDFRRYFLAEQLLDQGLLGSIHGREIAWSESDPDDPELNWSKGAREDAGTWRHTFNHEAQVQQEATDIAREFWSP